jgi:hypothetical protein
LPIPIGRNIPIKPAYPDEILLFVIPGPVTRNPFHVVAVGFGIGRQFRNGWWRRLRGGHSLTADIGTRLSERFVDGTAVQNLNARVGGNTLVKFVAGSGGWKRGRGRLCENATGKGKYRD